MTNYGNGYLLIENVRINDGGFTIRVLFLNGDILEFSSDELRMLRDKIFAKDIQLFKQDQRKLLGQNLKGFRLAKGVSLPATATLVGMTEDLYYQLENGSYDLPDWASRIVTTVEVLGGEVTDLA